jgi:hypothetical protein
MFTAQKPKVTPSPRQMTPKLLAPALGISKDAYYGALCDMADQIGGCGSV